MIGLLLTACKNDDKKVATDGYVINGKAKGVYNGMRVYLKAAPDPSGREIPSDTAIVIDETFKFEGKTNFPQMSYLSVTNVNGFVPVMVENEVIEIDFNKEDVEASKVTGTKANEALSEYTKGFKKLMEERNEMNKEFAATMNPANIASREAKSKELENINTKVSEYPLEFLKTHTDNYFSVSLIENILQNNASNVDKIESSFLLLDSDIQNSPYGKTVASNIATTKKKYEGLAMLEIGKEAPDFTAPNPEGEEISLYGIRGKATIIDFWASWCGPCRRENPNVVKVYEKYHDKGLEIISVSLDKPGQKDNWMKAIKDDKLNWHHVSNLKYFIDPVAQQYNIQSIPATFILDENGIIVAKSLRGQQLEDKIAEMLN